MDQTFIKDFEQRKKRYKMREDENIEIIPEEPAMLVLPEDDFEEPEVVETQVVLPDEKVDLTNKITQANIISEIIKKTWEVVDLINNGIISLKLIDDEELVPALESIITNAYVDIGQLEKFLEGPAPESSNIDLGKDSAEEILSDNAGGKYD